MTAQLSRERLEEISESSSTLITVAEAIVMARMLLAGMSSEPVAVDEIAEQAGIDPAIADAYMQGYHDSESRNTTAQALPDEKWVNPDISFADENGFAEGWNESRQHAVNNGKVPPVVKGISAYCRGWNAFREAMLNTGPVKAATVPDGWKLVPVEPTAEMLASAKEWFGLTATAEGVYGKMIEAAPAAPEQEV